MKLETLFLQPVESLFYCDFYINFQKYFFNRMRDDLIYYNPDRNNLIEVYLIEKNTERFWIPSFNPPRYFVLNHYEFPNLKTVKDFKKLPANKTSSPRTFFISELDSYIKTSFAGRISSNQRSLDKLAVLDALKVSSVLSRLTECSKWPKNTAFLPEYGGVVWNGLGCIYRSTKPSTVCADVIIPLHSLCGTDINAIDDLPLFVQIANEKNMDPTRFLLDNIISQLIKSWYFFVFDIHRKITCHGQNILVGFDSNLNNFKIIHRDLQAKTYNQPLTYEEIIEISKLYDFHMGWLLFDEIKRDNPLFVDSKLITQGIRELYRTNVGITLCDHRVYEQGVGLNKKTVILEKEPKFR